MFSDESTKSFALVEIKKPSTSLVGGQYRGRNEVADITFENQIYSMSSDLSGSIVQVRNQIAVAVDEFRTANRAPHAA